MNSIEKYIQYHYDNARLKEIDTHLDAAVYIANCYNMTIDERYWFAFLNACCETTPTAYVIWTKFRTPTIECVPFVISNRDKWKFQYDVRWILYEFEKVVNSYLSLTQNGQEKTILSAMIGRTSKERLENFNKKFNLYRFGTYVSFLYTELLHYLCGTPISIYLDFTTNHSVRNGAIYALGLDSFGLTKRGVSPTDCLIEIISLGFYTDIYPKILSLDIPDRYKTIWAVETTLCTFNKFNHGRRWLGFYKERQRKEIVAIENNFQTKLPMLWEYRAKQWDNE